MIQFIGSKKNISFSILGANIKMSGYQQPDSSSDSSSDSSFGDWSTAKTHEIKTRTN